MQLGGQRAQDLIPGALQPLRVEHLGDVLRQPAKALQQVMPRRRVQGPQATVVVPGQQVVRLAVDIPRAGVGP